MYQTLEMKECVPPVMKTEIKCTV